MTIDEAIAHCKEKSNCSECGKEHEQLAVWLAELQRYKKLKEQGRLIEMPCDDESEKYRWHDLRKNPEDLPEDEQRVLFFTRPYDGEEEYEVRYWSGEYFDYYKEFCNDDCEGCVTYGTYKKEDVIAWREIEPFEEE